MRFFPAVGFSHEAIEWRDPTGNVYDKEILNLIFYLLLSSHEASGWRDPTGTVVIN